MTSVHPTAVVSSDAELAEDVEVGPYAIVGPQVRIGARSRVMGHVVLDGCTSIGCDCSVYPFACIGTQTQDLKYAGSATSVAIGDRTSIREYVTINSGTVDGDVTRVGDDCLLMAYCHVAHTCRVGNRVIMANCATLGGHIVVEDGAILGGLSAFHQFVRVGRLCIVGGCTKVTQDCPPYMMVDGNPARVRGTNRVGLTRRGVSADVRKVLKRAFKLLYRSGLSTGHAIERIRGELDMCEELQHLLDFIEQSRRGIVRQRSSRSGES